MDIAIVVTLLVVGVILLIIEMFLIPGLSVSGIAGVLFLAGGVFYAYDQVGTTAGHLSLLGSVLLMGVAFWVFVKSKALEKMSLKTEIDSKVDPLLGMDLKIGDVGIAISRLAPMGKIKINQWTVEAKSFDDFIDQDTKVVVVEINNTNVIVERFTN